MIIEHAHTNSTSDKVPRFTAYNHLNIKYVLILKTRVPTISPMKAYSYTFWGKKKKILQPTFFFFFSNSN